jgi:hypothetical protein
MTAIKILLAATAALFVASGAAMALDSAATKPAKVRTPESIACSKEADAKNLSARRR